MSGRGRLVPRTFAVIVSAGILAGGVLWMASDPRPVVSIAAYDALEAGGDRERGRLVFYAGGCASCHKTPGQEDHLKLGGGRALASPFGTFYAPNISPNQTDGIGNWKVGDLANALLAGVSPSGSHYYPAFPYPSFAHMRMDDIRDLMAFLRSLEPVAGRAPEHQLPFPFTIRRGIGLWKAMYFRSGPLLDEPSHTAAWNRGRYLVDALGHCAECHSPRNVIGAIIDNQRFAGGPNLEGKGLVPNITPHPNGIASWSSADIVEALTTGLTPTYDSLGGSMAEVIRNTAQLPESDRQAIAEYVRSLPPRAGLPKKSR
jgi:mono/diheme cytochrome c family protein